MASIRKNKRRKASRKPPKVAVRSFSYVAAGVQLAVVRVVAEPSAAVQEHPPELRTFVDDDELRFPALPEAGLESPDDLLHLAFLVPLPALRAEHFELAGDGWTVELDGPSCFELEEGESEAVGAAIVEQQDQLLDQAERLRALENTVRAERDTSTRVERELEEARESFNLSLLQQRAEIHRTVADRDDAVEDEERERAAREGAESERAKLAAELSEIEERYSQALAAAEENERSVRATLERQTNELELHASQLATAESELVESKRTVKRQTVELERLGADLADADAQVTRLRTQLGDAHAAVDASEDALAAKAAEAGRAAAGLAQVRRELARQQDALREETKTRERLEREVASLQEEERSRRAALASATALIEALNAELGAERDREDDRYAELEAALFDLAHSRSAAEHTAAELATTLDLLQAHRAEADQARDALNETRRDLEEARAGAAALAAELEVTRERLAEAIDDVELERARRIEAEARSEALAHSERELSKAIEAAEGREQTNVEALSAELAEVRAAAAANEEALSARDAAIADSELKRLELKQELDDATANLQAADDERQELTRRTHELEQTLEVTRQERADALGAAEDTGARLEDVTERLDEARVARDRFHAEGRSHDDELQVLRARVEELEAENVAADALRVELAASHIALAAREDELAREREHWALARRDDTTEASPADTASARPEGEAERQEAELSRREEELAAARDELDQQRAQFDQLVREREEATAELERERDEARAERDAALAELADAKALVSAEAGGGPSGQEEQTQEVEPEAQSEREPAHAGPDPARLQQATTDELAELYVAAAEAWNGAAARGDATEQALLWRSCAVAAVAEAERRGLSEAPEDAVAEGRRFKLPRQRRSEQLLAAMAATRDGHQEAVIAPAPQATGDQALEARNGAESAVTTGVAEADDHELAATYAATQAAWDERVRAGDLIGARRWRATMESIVAEASTRAAYSSDEDVPAAAPRFLARRRQRLHDDLRAACRAASHAEPERAEHVLAE